jgi:hypothetical protein
MPHSRCVKAVSAVYHYFKASHGGVVATVFGGGRMVSGRSSTGALVAAVVFFAAVATVSQVGAATAPATGWSAVTKWPEFMGGVWGSGPGAGGPDEARGTTRPKVKPEVAVAAEKSRARALFLAGSSSCRPHGIPVDVGGEFFFSRDDIFLMADLDYFITRRIHMNVSDHGDPDPSYYGHSIGRWDGDTLVVDTVGFLPEIVIVEGVPGGGSTRLEERFRLIGTDKMELTIKVTNAEKLFEPWVSTRVMTRHREWGVFEAYCNQNNREEPVNGEARLDLTPPVK